MKCPACESVLVHAEYEGVGIETCPDCNGEWIGGNHLRAIERHRAEDVARRSASRDSRRPDASETRRTCPRCIQPMQKYLYGKDKRIVIDQCPQCKGLWLDDGELEAIQHACQRWEDFVQAEGKRVVEGKRPRPIPSREAIAANFARKMTRASLIALIGKWILSLAILIGPAVALLYAIPELAGLKFCGIYAGAWVVILLIARYVEFCPDTDDLGWFGGLIDDPFSWSDDWNRSLLWWRLFFTPPKFVVNTFFDTLETVRR